MWTVLNAFGVNKLLVYGGIALLIIGFVGSLFLVVRKAGADGERAKQLTDALKTLGQEVRHRQKVEAMRTSEAKAKLKQRWSTR